MARVLVLDNYDSFTHNLVGLLELLGARCQVAKSDAISVDDVRRADVDGILVGPGPAGPEDAGVSLAVIDAFGATTPILGVCLGQQVIAHAFGGRVVRAERLMHGKTSPIHHDGRGLFVGLPSPFEAMRYHSLIVDETTLPACLSVTARDDAGALMALAHRAFPMSAVQFHPESHATPHGPAIVDTWLASLPPRALVRGAA